MLKNNVAILDFGSEKISVIIGAKDVNNTFSISGFSECEYSGFLNGEFLEPENLKQVIAFAISNAENDAHTKISEIYVGVPTEFTFCVCKNSSQNFAKPKIITSRDIETLFTLANDFKEYNKTHSVINQSSIYYVIDDTTKSLSPMGEWASKFSGCLSFILAENKFINLVNNILEEINIFRVQFVSSALAQAHYLFDEEQRDRYAILVDCGYITTSVSLVRGNGIIALSSFSLGGGHITADLSQCLKITFNEAESLKRKIVLSVEPNNNDVYEIVVGGNPTPIPSKIANDIVSSRIEVIAKGILKCINLWTFESPEFVPVSLTGGGLCYLKGAKDFLAKLINRNIDFVASPVNQLNKPHFTSCVGLLNMALNLDNLKKPKSLWQKIKGIFG